jgi:hypothetical protein
VCREDSRIASGGSCVYAAIAESFWGSIEFNCVFLVSDDSESNIRLHLKHSLGQRSPKLIDACCSSGYTVSSTVGHPPHCIIRVTVLRSEPLTIAPTALVGASLVPLPVKVRPCASQPPASFSPPSGGGTSASETSFLSFASRSITINISNSTDDVLSLSAIKVFEGISLSPQPTLISPSSTAALAFNSDHVSGGVSCGIDVDGVNSQNCCFKLRVANPLIGRSVVSAEGNSCANVEVDYVDGTHCVVTCKVLPFPEPIAAEVLALDNVKQELPWSPLRISTFCCSSPLESVSADATPSALSEAIVGVGLPDILLLQGCSAETILFLVNFLNVKLTSSTPLLSPPPCLSAATPIPSDESMAVANAGHVIISLAHGATLQHSLVCAWEGHQHHVGCSAFAVPHFHIGKPDVWIVSVNLATFDIDVEKRMDDSHEETLQSFCLWLQGLLAARPAPVILSGFFGIPGEDPASSSSLSPLSESRDFSRLKSMLSGISGVTDVLDVFRISNGGCDAGLTWDYTQNSKIESFDRLFARDSFMFILNPNNSSSSCLPVTSFVKPLGATPASRLSPHFGLIAMIKLLGGNGLLNSNF